MRKLLAILFVASLIGSTSTFAQNTKKMEKTVKKAVTKFVKGGDDRDLDALENILHKDFRVVLNGFFKAEEVSILTKESYIGLAKAEKIGGVKRDVKIVNIDIQQNIATVKAVLTSPEMRFTSFFSLVQTAEDGWKLIGDFPHAEKL